MARALAADSSSYSESVVALPSSPSHSLPRPTSKQQHKQQHKQQLRAAASLAFLERIERVVVTGTTYRDEREQVQFHVVVNDGSERAAHMSARKTRRDAKRVQPIVSYDNTKALSTLKSVHVAARKWSSAHADAAALCAYCSQFTSPAALQMWEWSGVEPSQSQTQTPLQPFVQSERELEAVAAKPLASAAPALTVVVNNRAVSANSQLRKIERCLNSYLESARRTLLLLPDAQTRSACPGCTHIPTLVASFLQNEDYSSVPVNVVLFSCQIM